MNEPFEKYSFEGLRKQGNFIYCNVAAVFVTPFAVKNFIEDNKLSFFSELFLIITLLINSIYYYFNKKNLINYFFLYLITLVVLIIQINDFGLKILFWSYPFYFSIYFLQEKSMARITAAFALVSLFFQSYFLFEIEYVLRFCITSIILIVSLDIVKNISIGLENRLSNLAFRDPLTNAFNRRYMNSILDNYIAEYKRDQRPMSVLMIDIDYFKRINDEHGHKAGDTVLVGLVNLINSNKREVDWLFRIGGEEFVLLLKNTSIVQAKIVAENLRTAIEKTELPEKQKITVSIGVADFNCNDTIDTWLNRADKQLYKSKIAGRNQIS